MRSDDGLYACVATNPAGEAESFGHLTVEFKPSFVNTPYADYWSWDGQIANITCLAESIPNATIRWFYNNRDLDKDKIPEIKKHGEGPQSWLEWRHHSWPADSDYTLEELVPQTQYEFQFSAQNDVGTGPWGATQSIVMPKRSPPEPPPLLDRPMMSEHPEAPVDTPVMSAYPTHFELRWNIPADNGEPITSYYVTWCTARKNSDDHWEQDKSGNCQMKTLIAHPHTTSYRLQPLQPGTQYMVHLHATNSIGTSKPSVLLLKTAPEK
ncbi:Fasciclin-2, partial [Gryllus bimaculatus]